ncbi:hypothetical protein ACJX0J_006041, partial [Zea mays]
YKDNENRNIRSYWKRICGLGTNFLKMNKKLIYLEFLRLKKPAVEFWVKFW